MCRSVEMMHCSDCSVCSIKGRLTNMATRSFDTFASSYSNNIDEVWTKVTARQQLIHALASTPHTSQRPVQTHINSKVIINNNERVLIDFVLAGRTSLPNRTKCERFVQHLFWGFSTSVANAPCAFHEMTVSEHRFE